MNAWDTDEPGLSNTDKGNQKNEPTKLSNIKSTALRIYMADNEAGDWSPVVRNRYELDIMSKFNYLDVWSSTHLPSSERTNRGNNLTRRVSRDRHRKEGCNNLFFDSHAEWLHKDENTTRYWCGEEKH